MLKPGTTWSETYARCVALAPEAFDTDRIANLIDGDWRRVGTPGHHVSPVDGVAIQGPPRIEQRDADAAVQAAVLQHRSWRDTSLEVRTQKVTAALDDMTTHRELLAMLLVWEIGKPWRLACADVDRCIDGVRWYVENIDRQLALGTPAARSPLRAAQTPRARSTASRRTTCASPSTSSTCTCPRACSRRSAAPTSSLAASRR
jgi:delta 1-pyrroline-5-carboxylate dehydrogenase